MAMTKGRRRLIPRRDTSAEARPGGIGNTPFSYTALILLALFALTPILVLFFNAFKTDLELGSNPLGPPSSWSLNNFARAWALGDFGQGLINSAILVAGTVVGVWVCAGLAAYALARLRVPFRRGITIYMLIVISLPVQMFLVPLFYLWAGLGLNDSLFGLTLIHIALNTPFAALLLETYLVGIPRELDEAAELDGANELQIATRVILPLSMPGFLTVGLITGLWVYGELFFAVTFLSTPDQLPVAAAFTQFQQGMSTLWSVTDAAGLIMIFPVVVLFLFMQRRFISGLASSGLR